MTSRFAHRPSAGLSLLTMRVLAGVLSLLVVEAGEARAQSTPPEMVPIDAHQILRSPDTKSDSFSMAVAISGDVLVVGAPNDGDNGERAGAAYVFEKTGGTWSFAQKLVAGNGDEFDDFGMSTAMDGDLLVVGARGRQANSILGSAYVFVRASDGTWTEEEELEPTGSQSQAYFGWSVAISQQTVVVGAPGDGELGSNAGAAHVFARVGNTWVEEEKLLAHDGAAGDQLGENVSITVDRILVGAPTKTIEDSEEAGAAYVFERVDEVWGEQQQLLPNVPSEAFTRFGGAVALAGDVAAISMTNRSESAPDLGVMHLFAQSAGTWAQEHTIYPVNGSGVRGWPVMASCAGRLLISSEGHGAWLYAHDGTGWLEQPLWASPGTYRGTSAAVTLDHAVVGDQEDRTVSVYSLRRELGEPCNFGWMCESDTCADNVCCSSACDGVCETCAATPGTCTSVNDAEDDTCSESYVCDDAGSCRLDNGQSCGGDPHSCASGFCANGVCCDTECDGGCDDCLLPDPGTCTTVATGSSGGEDPECAPYLCSGSASCPSGCTTDTQCASGYYCSVSGECSAQKEQGSACDDSSDCQVDGCRVCATGHCVDGRCCDTTCAGACSACDGAERDWSGAENGTCTVAPHGFLGQPDCGMFVCDGFMPTCPGSEATCSSDTDCGPDHYCNASQECQLRKYQGAACDLAQGADCLVQGCRVCETGHCSDGVCCDSSCDGGCNNCLHPSPGNCTTVASGSPGDDPGCGPYVCSGSATCPGDCTTDTQCASGHFCSAAGVCTEQKEQGSTCDDTSDCRVDGCRVCEHGAGRCVDGYCCDTTCDGACSACDGAARDWSGAENGTCTVAPGGFLGEPSCGTFVCDGSTPTCPGSDTPCSSDDDCGPDHYCDASQECEPRKSQGSACDLDQGEDCLVEDCRVCQTGHCADGVCCDLACEGGCNACRESQGADEDGVCTVVADGSEGLGCGMFLCDGQNPTCPETGSCLVDTDCDDDSYCTEDGGCAERKGKGQTCSGSRECAPVDSNDEGYCVDGYCCDLACTNGCEACAGPLKANGTDDGTCGPAKAGTDPHDTCPESPQTSCGETGVCDGAGDCQLWPSNTSCGATFCTLENVTGQVCNGVGDCVDVTDLPCAPYLCRNDACTSPCESSQQCIPDHFCSAGVCAPGADAGTPCTIGQECSTGFCVDGVCCNSECSGQCEACAFPGSLGSCIAISGEPFAPRPACAGEPPCQGSCDGGDRTSCSYPDEATSCSEPNCEGDVLHQGARCDGAGQCAEAATQNCIPYGCNSDSGECRDQCSIDAECATGARCDEESEKCTSEGNQCADAFTIESPSGELTSCAPYKCDAGACQQQCTRDSDCQQGHGCDDSRCVELDGDPSAASGSGGSAAGAPGDGPDAKSGSDGGCGCRTAPTGGGSAAWWLVATVGIGLLRRRRLVQDRIEYAARSANQASTGDWEKGITS